MITSVKKIALKAQRGHYAVPAFNVSNIEMTQAVVRAAVKLKSPIIVQTSESALKYAGHKTLLSAIENIIKDLSGRVPISIHVDHGKHLGIVKKSLRLGFPSVHMDASEKNYATNVKLTKAAVQYAKKYKATVQGELGALLGYEGLTRLKKGYNYNQMMTDPVQASDFVRKTGIDTLAVNVGTIHGSFKGLEKIDIKRLRQIAKLVSVPLVLHGGSGNKPSEIKQAIKAGVCIINVDTDLRLAWASSIKKIAAKIDFHKKVDPRKILSASFEAMQLEAEKKIKLFGSNNKA